MSEPTTGYLSTLSTTATEEICQTLGLDHSAFVVVVIGADGVQHQLLPAEVNIEPVDNKIPLDFINISINTVPEAGKTDLENVMSQYKLCNIAGKWRPC